MSDLTEVSSTPTDRDRGFTLLEILIVISTMAVLTAVLSSVVMVVLRTAPSSEVRSDDARSVRGLVTWIPQDVDAAPPSGFDTSPSAWPCAGSPPATTDSYNVLAITWSETTGAVNNFAASYRYELVGSEWRMTRYTCDDVATGTMTLGRTHNLTSALLPWNPSTPPVTVTMCDIEVVNGQCPAANQITTNTSPDVKSLKIRLVREDGAVTTIDAAPKNPDEDLANDPLASTNAIPTVSPQANYTHTMAAGDTDIVDLVASHNPTDADAGDTISVAIDSSEPMPPGITASTDDTLNVTITADPSLAVGTISTPLVLIISDQRAGWVEATITVNIANPPNVAPTVTQTTYNVEMAPLDTIVLPLDLTHGVFDADGDPLTVTVLSFPNSKFTAPWTSPADPLKVTVQAKNGAALGVALPIELLIEDGRGGSVQADLTVTIIAATSNDAPVVTSTDVAINMFAGDTTTLFLDGSHGASDPDLDPIWATIDGSNPQPAEITTALPGGLKVEVTADPTIVDGPVTLPVSLQIVDPHGEYVEVTITITIDPTPAPPSDCVLGTVAASPSPVSRQGGGAAARRLDNDVTVTVSYSGSCDGLVLKYDTGDATGLGVGTGRVFPPGSPSSIVILAKGNGGTEKWVPGTHTLTASTTSAVTPNAITTTLTVT